ncbi:MAG: hypothetical protein FWE63_08805 [Bacteroidales bacterium]|nr:hypothetical protein [Bacteroidales bacterium]
MLFNYIKLYRFQTISIIKLELTCTVLLFLCSAAYSTEEVDRRKICFDVTASLKQLNSIECRFSSDSYCDFMFYQKGDKVRSEMYQVRTFNNPLVKTAPISSTPASQSNKFTSVTTYDGINYFRATYSSLDDKNIIGHGQIVADNFNLHIGVMKNPVVLPLTCVIDLSQEVFSWAKVCDESLWLRVLSDATFVGETIFLDQPCLKFIVDRPLVNIEILLSKNYNFFPLRWVSISKVTRKPVSGARVTQYRVYDAIDSQNKLFIPTETVFEQPGLWPDEVCRIIEGTLKVNELIDNDIFTLVPTHNTLSVMNLDEISSQLIGEPLPTGNFFESRWSVARLFCMILGVFMCLVAVFSLIRKRISNAAGITSQT